MKANLTDKDINLIEEALVALGKNKKDNEFYDIVTLLNKLITAEEKGFYYTRTEIDIPNKTVKRVEKDNGIMIVEYIKELYNLQGETIYRGRNEYKIGSHRVILKSISTEIDNNVITDIVTYSIDYGDITGKLTVKSRNGKVLKIDEYNKLEKKEKLYKNIIRRKRR